MSIRLWGLVLTSCTSALLLFVLHVFSVATEQCWNLKEFWLSDAVWVPPLYAVSSMVAIQVIWLVFEVASFFRDRHRERRGWVVFPPIGALLGAIGLFLFGLAQIVDPAPGSDPDEITIGKLFGGDRILLEPERLVDGLTFLQFRRRYACEKGVSVRELSLEETELLTEQYFGPDT